MLLVVALLGVYHNLFLVKQVICQLEASNCPDKITSALNNLIKQPITQINTAELSRALVEDNSSLAKADVKVSLPGRVKVVIKEAVPLFVLKEASSSAGILFSDQAQVMDLEFSNLNLPTVYAQQDLLMNDSSLVATITKLVQLLDEYQITLEEITVISQVEARAKISEFGTVVFNLSKPLHQQVQSLVLISQQLEENTFEYLDLRFDKPIIGR